MHWSPDLLKEFVNAITVWVVAAVCCYSVGKASWTKYKITALDRNMRKFLNVDYGCVNLI